MGCRIVGSHLQNLVENTGRPLGISIGQDLFGHRDELGNVLLRLRVLRSACFYRQLRQDLIQRLLHLRFASCIGQVGDRLPLKQRVHGRYGLHLELGGDELFFIDIDFPKHHTLVGILTGNLFEHRSQGLAWPTPFSVKIEDHELGHRRFDDFGLEAFDRLLLIHARHVSPPFN